MQITPALVQEISKDPAHAATLREGQQLSQAILKRSTTDAAFRRALVASPRPTVAAYYEEMFGKAVDASTLPDIRFVESPSAFTYVLPDAVDAEAELSEDELAAVAGGLTPTVSLVATYALGVGVTMGIVWAVDAITHHDDK